jgi:hypothetical protein
VGINPQVGIDYLPDTTTTKTSVNHHPREVHPIVPTW